MGMEHSHEFCFVNQDSLQKGLGSYFSSTLVGVLSRVTKKLKMKLAEKENYFVISRVLIDTHLK
jgi:hypothetical protein